MTHSATMTPPELDQLCVNTVRFLAVDIPAGVPMGGYVLVDSPPGARPDIILIATGSEVHLAMESRDRLATEGVQARVVSLPSTNIFAMQSDLFRDKVLPPGVPLLAIEASSSLGWRSYVGPQIAVIGMDIFGASAPGPVVMHHYCFTVENVCKLTHDLLRPVPSTPVLEEQQCWVADVEVPGRDEDVSRVTLTAFVLNCAAVVSFLVAVAAKAAVLRDVLEGLRDPSRLPAQLICSTGGELRWLVDRAAASLVSHETMERHSPPARRRPVSRYRQPFSGEIL